MREKRSMIDRSWGLSTTRLPLLEATGHLLDLGFDRSDQRLDPGPGKTAADEHEARAAVAGGPAVEPGGRVEDVLDAVDDGGPVGALGDVDDALQAQQVAAAVLGQRLQQQR